MMWKILENVQTNKDQWSIREIDCFTKPHALAIESLLPNKGLYDSYLYYLALSKSYGFCHNFEEGQNWAFDVHPFVANLLGFKYDKQTCKNSSELQKFIKDKIDAGQPVLVPGNLRNLYYSWSYKTTDGLHIFLIKGYNEELGLYSIQDCMHNFESIPDFNKTSESFTSFLLPMNVLIDCWEALHEFDEFYYLGSYYLDKAITIEKPVSEPYYSSNKEKLEYFANFSTYEQLPSYFREISVFGSNISKLDVSSKAVDEQFREAMLDIFFGSKRACLSMVKDLISEFVDEEKMNMINNHISKIISGWAQFKDLFYLHALRGNLKNIKELEYVYKPILDMEQELMVIVKKCIE